MTLWCDVEQYQERYGELDGLPKSPCAQSALQGNGAAKIAARQDEVPLFATEKAVERAREAPLEERYEDDDDYDDLEDDFEDIYVDEDVDSREDARQNLDMKHSHEQEGLPAASEQSYEADAVVGEIGQQVGNGDEARHAPQMDAFGLSGGAIVQEDDFMDDTITEGAMAPFASHVNMVAVDAGEEEIVGEENRDADEEVGNHEKGEKATKKQYSAPAGAAGEGMLKGGHGETGDRPTRSRRGQISPAKRWSSKLGVWVDVSDGQVGSDADKAPASAKGKATTRRNDGVMTSIAESGRRVAPSDTADDVSTSPVRGGKAMVTEAVAKDGARVSSRQSRTISADRRRQDPDARASPQPQPASRKTSARRSQADDTSVGKDGARRPLRQAPLSMRWSSTSGQWVPAETSASPSASKPSSPDKLQGSPKDSSIAQRGVQSHLLPKSKARVAGGASNTWVKGEQGGTLARKSKNGAEAAAPSSEPSPVKVENADEEGGVEEDDGEVVMRHRASIGPSPSKSEQSAVSSSVLE